MSTASKKITPNKTILKWAGSKIRTIEQLRPHLPKTKRLIEPFAGSMAIFMNTQYERYVLGDANPDLINMYRFATYNHRDLIDVTRRIFDSAWQLDGKATESERYYQIRARFNKEGIKSLFRAAYFIYLNRHGFRGLCRYNRNGNFNVPYGEYKKPYFPEAEIRAFAAKVTDDSVNFVCKDWFELLNEIQTNDGIYCDPPFMGTSDDFSDYWKTGFTNTDHENLAHTLASRAKVFNCHVTVSNSIAAKALYADLGFTIHEIDAPRSISVDGNRKPAREIIAVLKGNK